jgi:3-oxocholest-4-en-26-oyl-CoA dehydrogenase beta subunit
MDFGQTETQRELGLLTRQILTDRLSLERLREVEAKADRFDRELWAALAGAGVLSAALPEAAGGDGLGLLEQCAVLIELGRAVAPVPYLSSIVASAAALARFGDLDQIERWAVPAGRGEVVLTAALTEEYPATARRSDGRWVLTGAKTAVPAAVYADVFLVPAGDGVFLVARSDAGVTVQPQQLVDGDGSGRIELVRVELTDDRRLPWVAREWLVDRATVGLCAAQVGVLERALELTAEHARTRVQFGRPIGAFQAVTQRLADAYIDVEAVRLAMWQAAWRLSVGGPCRTEIATAKFWAAEAGHRVAHTAVHVHGGVGVDVDGTLHRYFVAAKYNEFTLGGATAQLRRIGAVLAEG